jgi:hypothetical protein
VLDLVSGGKLKQLVVVFENIVRQLDGRNVDDSYIVEMVILSDLEYTTQLCVLFL